MPDIRRLDAALVARGLCTGRDRAAELVRAGRVTVNGTVRAKPSYSVQEDDVLLLADADALFVSRAGDKLERALQVFELDIAGRNAIDVGASTGGFTDCMLRHNAAHVFAVDVGTGQLAPSLRDDPRVDNMEQTDIRTVTPETLGCRPDFCTADVSFISLAGLLPHLHPILADGAPAVCLVKPQFEAGRAALGKSGVIRDPKVHARVLFDFCRAAADAGFRPARVTWSPVRGSAGNLEFLACLIRCDSPQASPFSLPQMLELARAAASATAEGRKRE